MRVPAGEPLARLNVVDVSLSSFVVARRVAVSVLRRALRGHSWRRLRFFDLTADSLGGRDARNHLFGRPGCDCAFPLVPSWLALI
jgi:hypothetical protein